jgi:glycosyltransferase involved in cell wall biosynthesis
MKIALFDPYGGKFTDGMQKWWREHGYEVEYQRYYNPQIAEQADVLWFETTDNNIASATNPGQAILADDANYKPWDLHDMDMSNKKVIVRAIDIEVWQGHFAAAHWDLVDDLIFIAPHVRTLVDPDALPLVTEKLKLHTIPCAVDLDKWTFKERGPGFDIAVISEKWTSKGTDLILQIALKLKQFDERYKIHWLGQRSDYPWEYAYFDEFVEHHNLNIEFTNILNDGSTVDDFLEGKNFLLHASHKEGFSYATAEAMAKGIKPVIHRFFGADDLWGSLTWSSIDEAIEKIVIGEYDSHSYRQFLINHGYVIPDMMEAIDKVIKGESR